MQNTVLKTTPVKDQITQNDIDFAVSQETYAMVTDVLANKIMSALSAGRFGAATESADELFKLLDKGVAATNINGGALAGSVMDIILSEQTVPGELARKYLKHLSKYGVDFSNLDIAELSNIVEKSRYAGAKTHQIKGAEEFLTEMTFEYIRA